MDNDKINFDDYVQKYNTILSEQLHFFEEDNDYFAKYKVIKTKSLLKIPPKNILDFGCGIGRSTFFLKQEFPFSTVYGCDTSEKSLIEAKKRVSSAHFLMPDELHASKLQFDLIFVACVFHHVTPSERQLLMEKLIYLSKISTNIVVFEHNPFNPITRHLVRSCPFDKDAVLLKPKELKTLFIKAGLKKLHCHYTLFFPSSLQFLRPLEHYLRFIPFGGQYVVSGQVQNTLCR